MQSSMLLAPGPWFPYSYRVLGAEAGTSQHSLPSMDRHDSPRHVPYTVASVPGSIGA